MKKPTVGETQMTTIILQTEEEKQLWKSVAIAVAVTDKYFNALLGIQNSRMLQSKTTYTYNTRRTLNV